MWSFRFSRGICILHLSSAILSALSPRIRSPSSVSGSPLTWWGSPTTPFKKQRGQLLAFLASLAARARHVTWQSQSGMSYMLEACASGNGLQRNTSEALAAGRPTLGGSIGYASRASPASSIGVWAAPSSISHLHEPSPVDCSWRFLFGLWSQFSGFLKLPNIWLIHSCGLTLASQVLKLSNKNPEIWVSSQDEDSQMGHQASPADIHAYVIFNLVSWVRGWGTGPGLGTGDRKIIRMCIKAT